VNRAFTCVCGQPIFFRNSVCLGCGRALGYDAARGKLLPLEPTDEIGWWRSSETGTRPRHFQRCQNLSSPAACNWLIPPATPRENTPTLCLCCRLTRTGGVEVAWEPGGAEDPDRWTLTVKDTGPGIRQAKSSELKEALEVATQHADQVVADTQARQITHVHDEEAGVPPPGESSETYVHGEGIGLSIVKRLCEVLDATVRVDSDTTGTTFEIVFPRAYD
jgi:hypothetical protein